MRTAEIAIVPAVNRWQRQVVVVNECQYMLMLPIGKRAVSGYSLAVGLDVGFATDKIAVRSAPA